MTRAAVTSPSACEFVIGGTRPADVARLRTALAQRLAAVESGQALPLLVPLAPAEDTSAVRQQIRQRLKHGGGQAKRSNADVLVRTSGSSTGTGRLVCISTRALLASAQATHAYLGGPGSWVIALPTQHVAGLQMLVRSLLAGSEPVIVDTSEGFSPARLVRALQQVPPRQRTYVSLVPTQLRRIVEAAPQAGAVLAQVDAVLIGGAATAPTLLHRAQARGIRVVTTYGMSETGGGCVYDGQPLTGVEASIEADTGRVVLAGPMLASGYLDPAPRAGAVAQFCTQADGRRILRTADRGSISSTGLLQIHGRLDDVIISGGIKVDPVSVERVLEQQPGISHCCVLGIPDEQWGQAVVAAVVPQPGAPVDEVALRSAVRARLGPTHTPKRILLFTELPLRGPGKVDRRRLMALVQTPAAAR